MADETLIKPWAGLGFACPHCGQMALHEATRAEFDALEKHHEIERGARKRADLEVERLIHALAAAERDSRDYEQRWLEAERECGEANVEAERVRVELHDSSDAHARRDTESRLERRVLDAGNLVLDSSLRRIADENGGCLADWARAELARRGTTRG